MGKFLTVNPVTGELDVTVRPATQAEVNAGVITDAFVSPDTLAGYNQYLQDLIPNLQTEFTPYTSILTAAYEICSTFSYAADQIKVGDIIHTMMTATTNSSAGGKNITLWLNTAPNLAGAINLGWVVNTTGAVYQYFVRNLYFRSATELVSLDTATPAGSIYATTNNAQDVITIPNITTTPLYLMYTVYRTSGADLQRHETSFAELKHLS